MKTRVKIILLASSLLSASSCLADDLSNKGNAINNTILYLGGIGIILMLAASIWTYLGTKKTLAERKAKADLNNKTP